MEYKEFYVEFKSYKIYNRIYNFNSNTDHAILFLHNKNTHIGYLDLLLNDLSFNKYKIYAFDIPSRGKSVSLSPGHFDIYKELPQFLKKYISTILKDDITQLSVIGESLGALLAFYIYHRFKNITINKLIFMPGIYSIKEFNNIFIRFFIQLLNIFLPKMVIKSKTAIVKYTENKKIQDMIKHDNLFQYNTSIRFIYGIYKYSKYMKRYIKEINIPLLIFHGQHDHYTSNDDLYHFVSKYLKNKEYLINELKDSKHWLLGSDSIHVIKKEIIKFLR